MKTGAVPSFSLVGAVLVLAGSGHATGAYAVEPLSSGWEFTVAPYLWGAGLDGNARLGRIKADVDVSFGNIIENFSIGGNIHLEARKERFGVYADPLFIRIRNDADVGPVNVSVRNDTFIFAAGVFYRVLDLPLDEADDGGTRRFWVEPLAGARLTYLRLELDPNRGLPQADRSETWAADRRRARRARPD